MKYKGYTARVEFDEDAEIFYGYILGIKDVVDFQATSVSALQKAFKESVNDYLAFCKKRGELPNKPYSGHFPFRTSPEIHRSIALAAEKAGKSINQWLEEAARYSLQ